LPSGKVGSGGATYLGGGGRKIDNGPLKTQTQPTGQTIVNALPYKRTQGKYPAVKRNPSPLTKRPKRNPRGPRPTIR
jgi:hypothetical protein